ncbi:hypothetical protein DFH07DRAFT_960056 [Mycena maculata]|uniref:Uncharacterized protein n=1 Tax=Mycena maculata TaxID=230809 RepID=A0AAD7IZ34_9AGAR|nr:hypothetical protein DFH07DRAFT_960056 [Mycena maculata]
MPRQCRGIFTRPLNMRAPALCMLSICNCTAQMSSVLSQWSQAGFLPSHLQSLELSHCLSEADIPFLIGWLARLPALLRLTIVHNDEISNPSSLTASVENDLFRALASPDGAGPVVGGWLCLSLIHTAPVRNLMNCVPSSWTIPMQYVLNPVFHWHS